jgi:hypothetical protein
MAFQVFSMQRAPVRKTKGLNGNCGDGISSVQHAKGISEEDEMD